MKSIKVMRGGLPELCLLVALAVGASGDSLCQREVSWWNRERGACLPCTRCDPAKGLVVKYPCETHRDTICQSINEIRIYPFNGHKRQHSGTNGAQSSDYEYYDYADYEEVSDTSDGDVKWDLQTSSLTLAISGCVVFFVVVLVLSLYHAKQWKVLKQALKSDVKDLTARLKLMEAGGESPAEPVAPTDHHIYCNIHVGKDALLGPTAAKKGLGNVYTQEKHPS